MVVICLGTTVVLWNARFIVSIHTFVPQLLQFASEMGKQNSYAKKKHLEKVHLLLGPLVQRYGTHFANVCPQIAMNARTPNAQKASQVR